MKKSIILSVTVAAIAALTPPDADACTRCVFIGDDGNIITGRNLDWREDIPTNLYVFPRGIKRAGYDTDSTLTWTSQYGSVSAVSYDIGVTEGMNEKGLVANILYLPGTSYTYPGDTRLYMSSSMWAQWVLDNFATVDEAAQAIALDRFRLNAPAMPGGTVTTIHLAISDATGNSAIVEYIDGKLSLHVGKQYKVLTNAPPYEQQTIVNDYWKIIGGHNMLPGTNRSQDRFVRASFYIDAIPENSEPKLALAGVFGVLFNCSVPVGMHTEGKPEESATRWRSVSDQKRLIYYYATLLNPSVMWVDLNDFELQPGAPIMKLDVINAKKAYIGNVIKDMRRSTGFKPLFRYN